MRPITEIIIHATATEWNWWAGRSTAAKVAEVKRWHVEERKWRDIGYHYLIDRDGTVATGRPLDQVGAHVAGHNSGTIGISLFGGHRSNEKDKFRQHFTPEQDKALRKLIADLRGRFPAVMKVTGHNQYAAKACPGFQVSEWLAEKPVKQTSLQDQQGAEETQGSVKKPSNSLGKPSWLASLIAAVAAMLWSKK